jgi:hypothetical protein
MPAIFIGSKFRKSMIKRMPLWRGKGKQKAMRAKPAIVQLASLSKLPAKSVVDIHTLVKAGFTTKNALHTGVKILGKAEIKNALFVRVPCSKQAKLIIEKAGGSVGQKPPEVEKAVVKPKTEAKVAPVQKSAAKAKVVKTKTVKAKVIKTKPTKKTAK